MTDLRDKIAEVLAGYQIGSGYYATAIGVGDAQELADDIHALLTEEAADAVLAVLDDVRAEAWERGFDAGQAWESDVSSRVIPSVCRQDNPYRKAEK